MISARLALGMAGALALCAPAWAEELVLPSEVASSHWKTGYMEQFAQKVNEATDGDIEVKIFPSGQLYSDQAAVAALGTGAVQMVWPVSVRLETIAPETGVINLPFALSDDMMLDSCMKDGIRDMLTNDLQKSGLRVLGLLRTADLYFIMSDTDVQSMQDFRNAKIRVTGGRVVQDTMEALGISPISMAASEMSTALSQGAIDGIFTSPAGWAEMIGMTGKYAFYVPGFSILTYAVVVDDMWFQGLPPDQQQAIQTSIDEISATQWQEAMAKDKEALDHMIEQGAKVTVADESQIAEWRELTTRTSASFSEAYPETMQAMQKMEDRCGVGS